MNLPQSNNKIQGKEEGPTPPDCKRWLIEPLLFIEIIHSIVQQKLRVVNVGYCDSRPVEPPRQVQNGGERTQD
jgi:hypothetical protein